MNTLLDALLQVAPNVPNHLRHSDFLKSMWCFSSDEKLASSDNIVSVNYHSEGLVAHRIQCPMLSETFECQGL